MRQLRNTVFLEGSYCGCVYTLGGCPRNETLALGDFGSLAWQFPLSRVRAAGFAWSAITNFVITTGQLFRTARNPMTTKGS